MAAKVGRREDYTAEERMILASLRRKSGRTCVRCRWLVEKGQHRGCYPEGKYRKFLSRSEFEAGCDSYSEADRTDRPSRRNG